MMYTMCAIFIDFVCGLGVYSFKISREELWEKWGITCISADTAFIILFVMYVFVVIYTLTLVIMQDTDLFDKK